MSNKVAKPKIVYLFPDSTNRGGSIFDNVHREIAPHAASLKQVNLDTENGLTLARECAGADIVLHEAPMTGAQGEALKALAGGEPDGNGKFIRVNPFQPRQVAQIGAMIARETALRQRDAEEAEQAKANPVAAVEPEKETAPVGPPAPENTPGSEPVKDSGPPVPPAPAPNEAAGDETKEVEPVGDAPTPPPAS